MHMEDGHGARVPQSLLRTMTMHPSIAFFVGATIVPLILVIGYFFYQSVVLTDAEPADAELQYASHSTKSGEGGGLVVPASCESGVAHFPGDTDSCLQWVEYCTNGYDANPWQRWRYSTNHYGDGVRYERASWNDGWCLPPPTDWIGYSCSADGSQANVWWKMQPGTNRSLPRIRDIGATNCASKNNWTYLSDGTCYTDWHRPSPAGNEWSSEWFQLRRNTGDGAAYTHSFWVHLGTDNSVGQHRSISISCPVSPPPPTNLTASCNAAGNQVTMNWNAPAGFGTFQIRAGSGGLFSTNGIVAWSDYHSATSYTFNVTPGMTYYYWVETKNTSTGWWSPAASGSITCAGPVQPIGNHDGQSCTNGVGRLSGWTCDPDNFNQALSVHIYEGGPAGGGGTYIGQTVANLNRTDVGAVCGGTTAHGFEFAIPDYLNDGYARNYYAYAIDDGTRGAAGNPQLGGSQSLSCALPAPASVAYTCSSDGRSAVFTWPLVTGADQYYPRIGGLTQSQCAAIGGGWTWWTDNYTCYKDRHPTNQVTLPLNLDGSGSPLTHAFWIHAGDPVPYNWPAAGTGDFTCPLPAATIPTLDVAAIVDGVEGEGTVTIAVGQEASVVWRSTNTTRCYPGTGSHASLVTGDATNGSDTTIDEPAAGANRTFRVTCDTTTGTTITDTVIIRAVAVAGPTADIRAFTTSAGISSTPSNGPVSYSLGDSVSVTWSSANASQCTVIAGGDKGFAISGATLASSLSGTDPVTPDTTGTTRYAIRCTGPGGTAEDYVDINSGFVPATVDFGARNTIITKGQSTTLWWEVDGTYEMQCRVTGGGVNHSFLHNPAVSTITDEDSYPTPPLQSTTVFTLTCEPTDPSLPDVVVPARVRVEVVPGGQET